MKTVFSVKRTYLNRCLFITSTIIINRYLLNYLIQLSSNYSTLLYSLLMLKQKKPYIKGQKNRLTIVLDTVEHKTLSTAVSMSAFVVVDAYTALIFTIALKPTKPCNLII